MDDVARGIGSYYSSNYDQFLSRITMPGWTGMHSSVRNLSVLSSADNPSAKWSDSQVLRFTHLTEAVYTAYGNLHSDLEIDVNNSSFSLPDNYVADDYKVRIKRPLGTTLPVGLLEASMSYFVVNSTGTSFQLSETVGGPPIELSGTTSGPVYLELFGGKRYYGHDGAVHYWPVYAARAHRRSQENE